MIERIVTKSVMALMCLLFIGCTSLYSSITGASRVEECTPSLQLLLIDQHAMRTDWREDQSNKNDEYSRGAADHCTVDFFGPDGEVAFEQIFEYKTNQEATEDYSYLSALFFWKKTPPFPVPAYDDASADNFEIDCGLQADIPMCAMLGQYGKYIVHFNTHMSSKNMTEEDFARVIRDIDELMLQN